MGSKTGRSLKIIMKPLPFLPLDSWTHEYWLWMKRYNIANSDLKHMHCHTGPCPNLTGNCHIIGSITKYSKIHFTVLSSQLHQDDREQSKIREFQMSMGPLPDLICCDGNSAVWDTLVVHKALCKPMGYCFCILIAFRKRKSTSRGTVVFQWKHWRGVLVKR